MSPPLEHDYIGLSPAGAAVEGGAGGRAADLNLKETELRLGPPGSGSPDRKEKGIFFGLKPGFVAGAKRGFSDAIDGKGKWAFDSGVGSEAEMGKGAALFPAKGDIAGGGGKLSGTPGAAAAAAKAAVAGEGSKAQNRGIAPGAKAQVVGWPPIRNYRKNNTATTPVKNKEDDDGKQGTGCMYIKVSMDGAPYLRKVDLKTYCNYNVLSSALEKMFSGFTSGISGQCGGHGIPERDALSESRLTDLLNGSEYVLTYEDKDGDWMLVGDVPWERGGDEHKNIIEKLGLVSRQNYTKYEGFSIAELNSK